MLLDIIIPQYNEDEAKIKRVLDSILNQRNVDFNLINVMIVNDGSDVILKDEFLVLYSKLNICYIKNEKNTGPGLARQFGIDHTDLPYIMFLDADDELFNQNVLENIISYLQKYEPKYLVTSIVIEKLLDDKIVRVVAKGKDTFPWMHGKVFKRSFLKENNLRFSPNVRHLEDSYFTTCVLGALGFQNISYLDMISYAWLLNKESLTRKKSTHNYMVDTFYDYFNCPMYVYEYLCNINSNMRFPYFIQSSLAIYTVLNSNLFDFEDCIDLKNEYLAQLKERVLKKKNIFMMAKKETLERLYSEQIALLKNRNDLKKIYKNLTDFMSEMLNIRA